MTDYEFKFKPSLGLPPEGPPIEFHRSTVTGLICQAKFPEAESVCVLGAGPCNDLNLRQLLDTYTTVHLVDLDEATVRDGIAHQQVPKEILDSDRLQVWGNYDLVGIHRSLSEFASARGNGDISLDSLIQQARVHQWDELPKPVDVIASTCLLSQLVMQVVDTVGDSHAQFVELIKTIRQRHIELMIEHLRPGGRGLLIFDFVSSDTLEAIKTHTGDSLKRVLSAAIDQGNFFHGMNPQVIHHLLETEFSDHLRMFNLSAPWVWNAGSRCYAVMAYLMEKRATIQE